MAFLSSFPGDRAFTFHDAAASSCLEMPPLAAAEEDDEEDADDEEDVCRGSRDCPRWDDDESARVAVEDVADDSVLMWSAGGALNARKAAPDALGSNDRLLSTPPPPSCSESSATAALAGRASSDRGEVLEAVASAGIRRGGVGTGVGESPMGGGDGSAGSDGDD